MIVCDDMPIAVPDKATALAHRHPVKVTHVITPAMQSFIHCMLLVPGTQSCKAAAVELGITAQTAPAADANRRSKQVSPDNNNPCLDQQLEMLLLLLLLLLLVLVVLAAACAATAELTDYITRQHLQC